MNEKKNKKNRESIPQYKKMVSVLIAAYKASEWIQDCVQSLLCADHPLADEWGLEILIGIDGCPETLREALKIKDSRVGIIYFAENSGTYITFNSLVSYARGDFLLRMDADDLVSPNRTHKMLDCFLKDSSLGMVSTWRTMMNHDMSKKIFSKHPREVQVGACMWSRAAWNQLGGFKEWRVAADTDMALRASYLNIKSNVLEDPKLYFYRKHHAALTKHPDTNRNSSLRMEKNKMIRDAMEAYKKSLKPGAKSINWKIDPKIIKKGRWKKHLH